MHISLKRLLVNQEPKAHNNMIHFHSVSASRDIILSFIITTAHTLLDIVVIKKEEKPGEIYFRKTWNDFKFYFDLTW